MPLPCRLPAAVAGTFTLNDSRLGGCTDGIAADDRQAGDGGLQEAAAGAPHRW